MKKKTLLIILAVLVVLAAVLAVIVSRNQPQKAVSEVIIVQNGKQAKVDLGKLDLTDVKATVTRANGKTLEIDAKGLEMRKLLEKYSGYTTLTVSAEDNYTAEIKADELQTEKNVYLIIGEENKPRLVVLSDSNAKRDVKNVLTIELK
ncbi:MAG: hypothetical protein IIZ86_01845 [Firmicutes bacterium]|nr:hypothetical protein [Bacillota bacterium]MBQ3931421.1 hypothetical protein [Bacillota bacterium]